MDDKTTGQDGICTVWHRRGRQRAWRRLLVRASEALALQAMLELGLPAT
jgi:hypothetical protein